MIEILFIYAITFVGGFFISFVAGEMDWQERILYGIVNALIFGTILLLAIAVLTTIDLG